MTAGRKNQAAFDLGVKFARLDSIFGGAMFYRLLLVSTIFWLCACDRQPSTVTGGAVPLVAPSGQGFRIDMSGRSVPLFETIGLLRDDEAQDVTIGPDGLQGYGERLAAEGSLHLEHGHWLIEYLRGTRPLQ